MQCALIQQRSLYMTKAVIFDFGRVLGNFDKLAACKQFAESSPYSAEEIFQIIVNGRLEQMLESGQMSETAFCNELLYRCKVEKLTVPDVRRIWGNICTPNPAIDPVIDELMRQNTPIGVLSNTNSIQWDFIEDIPVIRKLIAYGASFTLSYQIKACKPDRIMFETALTRLGMQPDETLYLDDIIEFVEAARGVGMKAEQYDCTKDPDRISQIMTERGFLKKIV